MGVISKKLKNAKIFFDSSDMEADTLYFDTPISVLHPFASFRFQLNFE